MIQSPLFLSAFLLLIVIGILEQLGVSYAWFDRYVWFDIVLHFLGGAWVALVAAWGFGQFLAVRRWFPHASRTMFVLGSVVAIGALWEWYERLLGLHLFTPYYGRDVLEDLVFDTLGALIVLLLLALFSTRRHV